MPDDDDNNDDDNDDDDMNGNDDTDSGLEDEEYDVEYIVKSRFRRTRGKRVLEYLIHWKGYDTAEDSWTTADQFDDDDPPVLKFYEENPTAAKVQTVAGKRTNGARSNERTNSRSDQRVRSSEEFAEGAPKTTSEESKGASKVASTVGSGVEDEQRSGPSGSRYVSDSDDDVVLLPKKTTALTPKSTAVNGKSSPTSSPAVSGQNKPKGGILSYFSFATKKGKENEVPATKKAKEVKEIKDAKKPVEKPSKKRKPDPDESDFVLESEPDEGSDDLASAEEDEAEAEADEEDEEVDGESPLDFAEESTEIEEEPWMEQEQDACCQAGNSQCVGQITLGLTTVPLSKPASLLLVKKPT